MDPISLLKEEKDYKSAVSASALFWAISSLVVLGLKPFGLFSSYSDALPFVIAASWLAGEIAVRVPKRIPVAYCLECGWRVLPNYPLRRFWIRWGWKNCVKCGSNLITECERNKHPLSVYSESELPEDKTKAINCSKCGDRVGAISVAEYEEHISHLARSQLQEGRVGEGPGSSRKRARPPKRRWKAHQIEILNWLKAIVSHTEFDLLLSDRFDEAISIIANTAGYYSREDHEKERQERRERMFGSPGGDLG